MEFPKTLEDGLRESTGAAQVAGVRLRGDELRRHSPRLGVERDGKYSSRGPDEGPSSVDTGSDAVGSRWPPPSFHSTAAFAVKVRSGASLGFCLLSRGSAVDPALTPGS